MVPRCVVVERPTEYQELLERHGTREQVRFFLAQRGQSLDEVQARHDEQRAAHAHVLGAVPAAWRRASIGRGDLDRFLFEPDDVVVALGQDGLVANVAKYLDGQPVIGLNTRPGVNPGVLVTHPPAAAGDLFADLGAGRGQTRMLTMVAASLGDGQRLLALNEIFVGHASHQSARYELSVGERREHQSSSGVVIATGTGATGWAASLHRERHSALELPGREEARLVFFVREPWPSPGTAAELTEGSLAGGEVLSLTSELGEGGVVFGDGIEADRLRVDWGEQVQVQIADRQLALVA